MPWHRGASIAGWKGIARVTSRDCAEFRPTWRASNSGSCFINLVEQRSKCSVGAIHRSNETTDFPKWLTVLSLENTLGISGECFTHLSHALRWSDVLYVPLHPVLAGHLRAWQRQTPHAKETDFVFPSMRAKGRKPLCSCVFVADHLRRAAKKAAVQIEDGQRFGLHNLRHSLSNWMVNNAKVESKTVQ